MQNQRLGTLTGTGGVGKTRLAFQIASQEIARFDNNVTLVELADLPTLGLSPRPWPKP